MGLQIKVLGALLQLLAFSAEASLREASALQTEDRAGMQCWKPPAGGPGSESGSSAGKNSD